MTRILLVLGMMCAFASPHVMAQGWSDVKGDIERQCNKEQSNADFKNCRSRLTEKKFAQMKSRTCSITECNYKLVCKSDGDICSGQGYTVKFNTAGAGVRLLITDPTGKTTTYNLCGTCNDIVYESGPIHGAVWRSADDFSILTIPRRR